MLSLCVLCDKLSGLGGYSAALWVDETSWKLSSVTALEVRLT